MKTNLILGDCLEKMQEIPDGSIDLVLVDLPYGQTANNWDVCISLDKLWNQYTRISKENAAFLFTAKGQFMIDLILSKRDWYRYEWIWNKNKASNFAHCNSRPLVSHEFILVFYKKLPTYNPQMVSGKPYIQYRKKSSVNCVAPNMDRGWKTKSNGLRYPKTIIDVENLAQRNIVHPTQKPVSLMEYLIKTYTNEGETVLDNTMGSGTTGVACVNTNRNFIGIEMDESYFEIATKRIQQAKEKLGLFIVNDKNNS